jgi:hypothetical protein
MCNILKDGASIDPEMGQKLSEEFNVPFHQH